MRLFYLDYLGSIFFVSLIPKIRPGRSRTLRLYSISRVFGQRVFGEINMCELLILKLDLCLNVSDFTSIGQRWIHFLFNEKESSLEPRNSKNQNTFLSWFLVRKNSWRTPAGFSKFPTEISDRDFRPYRIHVQPIGCFLSQPKLKLKLRYQFQFCGTRILSTENLRPKSKSSVLNFRSPPLTEN